MRHSLLDRQIAALGLPAIKVMIPSPCPNAIYESRMAEACAAIRAEGVQHMIFGDLFRADIRAYREEKLASVGDNRGSSAVAAGQRAPWPMR